MRLRGQLRVPSFWPSSSFPLRRVSYYGDVSPQLRAQGGLAPGDPVTRWCTYASVVLGSPTEAPSGRSDCADDSTPGLCPDETHSFVHVRQRRCGGLPRFLRPE